ncbi:MAG: hypothetical protein ACE5Q6_11680 [Dehalococcoidia bacterium]
MEALRTTHQYEDGTEFPVDWPKPEDAQHTYRWDTSHNPYPLTPLSVDLLDKLNHDPGLRDFFYFRREIPFDPPALALAHPHGYWYWCEVPQARAPVSSSEEGLTDLQLRVLRQAPQIKKLWQTEYST